MERQIQLTEIKSQFGYGGFIHNFKNHVLRGTQKYADRFKKNKEGMIQAFRAYEKLNLSPEEQTALKSIRSVADQYIQAIEVSVSMHKDGQTPIAIDKTVKIDDSPAFKAFQVLEERVQSYEKVAGESLNGTIKMLELIF